MNQPADNPDMMRDEAAAPHRSSPGVIVACIFALVVFVAAITLLYWTWLPRQNPSAMIVVQGNEQYVGAEITAEPMDASSPPVTAKMSSLDDYRLRIHISPGVYRVTIRQNGRVLGIADRVPASTMEPRFIPLRSPTSKPTTKRLQ